MHDINSANQNQKDRSWIWLVETFDVATWSFLQPQAFATRGAAEEAANTTALDPDLFARIQKVWFHPSRAGEDA